MNSTTPQAPRGGRRRARGALVAAAALTAVMAVTPAASAGGIAAWELDHQKGREIVVANLGKYPGAFVIPGSATGPKTYSTRMISAESLGADTLEQSQVESGDVDGDGDGDLILSAPQEQVGLTPNAAGRVFVVPGASFGPSTEDAYSIDNPDPTGSGFGAQILAGDLDRDGLQDLVATSRSAGDENLLRIFWGSDAGNMSSEASLELTQPAGRIDHLLVVNLDGDVRRELVVVYGGRAKTAQRDAVNGRLIICDVTDERVVSCGDSKSTGPGIAAAAGADVMGNDIDDLVLGQPRTTGGLSRLLVYRGTPSGLDAPRSVTQDSVGVPGTDEKGDRFGSALAAADMDADGKADVAIGAPTEAKGGRVTILYGDTDGLGYGASTGFNQDQEGFPGLDEVGDAFGAALSLIDVDGSGRRDLVIGVPGEDDHAGALVVIRSNSNGRPNVNTALQIDAEDMNISEPACCGRLSLGNRIGQ